MTINIDNIIKKISDTVESHRLENEGEYARWIWQNKEGNRELGINEYGCADAINILYTIGKFPNTTKSREAHIEVCRICKTRKRDFLQSQRIIVSIQLHIVLRLLSYLMQSQYIL